MNNRLVLHTTGYILFSEALLMLLPAIVSLIYSDGNFGTFMLSILACAVGGFLLWTIKPKNKAIFAREGFLIVALSWLLLSAFGALPFLISGTIPNFVDAFFETVSGFTTTGATILNEVEPLGPSLLFWRSFTHWIGGMGILVFIFVILPLGGERSLYIMRAEVPGPTSGKLVPRMQSTAKILYGMYFGFTILEVILLALGGMPIYDSFIHAFGTAGTGGFSCKTASIAAYDSVYFDTVITIFMLMFGVNFNLYYLILLKQGRQLLKNEELRTYLAIVLFAIITITINTHDMYTSIGEALRYSSFQVASIITTTGYCTADFNLWPQYSRMLLLSLMFIGACASSTGGGMKVSRVMLLFRAAKRGVSQLLHPREVASVHLEHKSVEESVIREASIYFICYALIAATSTLLLSFDQYNFETNFSAMTACFNNIGPGLDVVGATGNYSGFTWFSKLVLSFDMLAGRLEIFPLLILFSPSMWRAKSFKS